ncbi:MAG: glycosyltransferase family 2 protein [Bosea sp.]|nr:glycosyltransferase family 2 protein [Bosea sp. (in: a-proteobacteria)]
MSIAVSIVLPTHNRAYCLKRAVGSILAQTFTDWELILIDDGSTDETPALVENFAQQLTGRFHSARLEKAGVSQARNRGIEMARGKWIAFQDSDDVWMPEKLGLQMNRLAAHPEDVFCFTDFFEFSDAGYLSDRHVSHQLVESKIYPELLRVRSNVITCPSVVAARHRVEALGGFNPSMHLCEDIDLWTRLAMQGPAGSVNVPLVGVHVRREAKFAYASGLMGRHDLLTRARARDPGLPPAFWTELRTELLTIYAEVAMLRGDAAAGRLLRAALVEEPADPLTALADLARTLPPST